LTHFLNSLGSIFLGKDIITEAAVALKIGHARGSSLRLSYEYNVYTTISGSNGIAKVLWYSKEDIYEVIVMEYLGTSLGDLVSEQQFDQKRTFLYAPQMVCWLYM